MQREMKQKMLIRQTINEMNRQINKLEEQKESYVKKGAEAKKKGLTDQYNLAVNALRMTLTQQKRVEQMKLNFEITSQMKDMASMTADFLKGMASISKDMYKTTKEVNFKKVQTAFGDAMMGMEMQTAAMENFMDQTQSAFAGVADGQGSADTKKEVEGLINNVAAGGAADDTQAAIERDLKTLIERMK